MIKVTGRLIGAAILLAGIFTAAARAQEAATNGLDKVSIQLRWQHQFQFAGYYAAAAKGFYAEEGLEVELKPRLPAQNHIQSVVDGEAEYGVADAGLILNRLQGDPVVLLAQIFQHSPQVFVARQDSGIVEPADLAGKRIMLTPQDSSTAPFSALLIQALGSADQAITVPHTHRLQEFIDGDVDVLTAYLTDEPFALRQLGIDLNIINPHNYGLDFYGDNLFTTEQELHRFPGRAERIRRATIRGWAYALDHPDEIIDLILSTYAPEASRERLAYEARMTANIIQPDLIPIGSFESERIRRSLRMYALLGMAESDELPDGFLYTPRPEFGLTPAEQDWLQAHPRITLGFSLDYEPALMQSEDGSYSGVVWDLLELIRARIPCAIDLETDDWPEMRAKAERREVDGLLAMDKALPQKLGLLPTLPYWTSPIALFTQVQDTERIRGYRDLADRKVAVIRGHYACLTRLQEAAPDAEVVEVDNALAGLKAVYEHQVDAFAGLTSFNYLILKHHLHGLTPAFLDDQDDNLFRICAGVRADWPELVPILNKAIASITDEERIRILKKWGVAVYAGRADRIFAAPPALELTPAEQAWLEQGHTVRVRISYAPPFSFVEPQPSGLTVDYLTAIAELTGLQLEFVPDTIGWDGSVRDLTGPQAHFDLIAAMNRTPEREEKFALTDDYLFSPWTIITRDDAAPINGLTDLRGKTVSGVQGFFINDKLRAEYPSIQLQDTDTALEALEAVSSGRVDAHICELATAVYLMRHHGLANLKVAAYTPFKDDAQAMGIRKDWPELASIINKGLKALPPEQKTAIEYKWMSTIDDHPDSVVALSPEERAWLQAHPVVRLAATPHWPPFDMVDAQGTFHGIDADYLELLGRRLGIRIEPALYERWQEVLDAGKRGEAEGIMALPVTPERETVYHFTSPYVVNAVVAVVRNDDSATQSWEQLAGKTLLAVEGASIAERAERELPGVTIVSVDSEKEGLLQLAAGRGDAFLGWRGATRYEIQRLLLTDLKIAFMKETEEARLRMAIHRDYPELAGAMQKAVDSITPQEHADILRRWMGTENRAPGLQALPGFDTTGYVLKRLAVILLGVVLLLFVVWLLYGAPRQFSIRITLICFNIVFACMILVIAALAVQLLEYHSTEHQLEAQITHAFDLTEELKQTCDNLSRFARRHALAGEESFESYFQMLVDMVHGRTAHPAAYSSFYWNQVAAGLLKPVADGETYNLFQELAAQASTPEETAAITEVQRQFRSLTAFQETAIQTVNGRYRDADGTFTVQDQPNPERANELLYGPAYLEAYSGTLTAIDRAYSLLERRILGARLRQQALSQAVILQIAGVCITAIVLAIVSYLMLRKRILTPLVTLIHGAKTIRDGDYTHTVDLDASDEIGLLAKAFNAMALNVKKYTDSLEQTQALARIGSWELDLSSNALHWSERVFDIFGISPEEFDADYEMFLDCVHPDDRARVDEAFSGSVARNEDGYEIEHRIIRKDTGEERYVYDKCKHERDETGTAIRSVGLVQDITARKQAEKELRHYQHIVSCSSDMMALVDTHLVYRTVNKAYAAAFGKAPDEIIGSKIGTWSEKAYFEKEILPQLQRCLQGETVSFQGWQNYSGYGPRYMDAHLVPYRNTRGETKAIVMSSRDITERVLAAEALAEAKEEAEKANRAKSEFIANVSHEIRTPLNAITGTGYLLQRTPLSKKQQSYLERIQSASDTLLAVINDVLDYSKIESGHFTIEPRHFHLDDLFEAVGNVTMHAAHAKGLTYLFEIEPGLPAELIGDDTRLRQILLNLTYNAIKFTESGSVVVACRARSRTEHEIRLEFSVKDTGIGIAPEMQTAIFREFSQADASISRTHGGTGLGLTISHRLVDLMDGSIWVESEEGMGSTFCFDLRLRLPRDRSPLPQPGHELNGLRILLVDDGRQEREVITLLLRDLGLDVCAVDSGETALQALEEAEVPFDLVLSDVLMEGINGIMLKVRIEQIYGPESAPPVILMTGKGTEEVARITGRHIENFLFKPFTQKRMRESIIDALGKERSHAQSAAASTDTAALNGIRVLLVEDQEPNRLVATELLESEGVVVEPALSGEAAITAVQTSRYDLILMDIQMPGMDGYEATRRIRKLPERGTLPILALSASIDPGIRREAMDAGMNDFLSKPFNPAELYAAIAQWARPKSAAYDPSGDGRPSPGAAPEQLRLQIDGLDMEAGLRRMAGRPELYETILKSFADSHADSITKLKTALESGDDRTAKRLAHSLKGAAATIEAAALHQAAVASEKAILDNQHESALAAVQTLEKRLEPLIRQIRQALIAPAANPARPVDADPEPVIARLKTYLEDGNPEALACLGELEAILPAAARLRPLVRKYAFEDAIEMLTTIISKT